MSSATKVYKTRITTKGLCYGAIPFASAGVLLHFALDAGRKFGPQDPTRYLFVGIPAAIAVTIVITLLVVCYHFLNREVILQGNDLTYKSLKTVMHLSITEMAFSPPTDSALLKTLMFSDGHSFVQIPELFLGTAEFVELSDTIQKLRRQRDLSAQKTYSL